MADNLAGDRHPPGNRALLLIDVINDMEFDGGEDLIRFAAPMAQRLAVLRDRAKQAGVPVIYVNDNFGNWRSDFAATVRHVCERDCRGKEAACLLRPEEEDYFVLKPMHSGFHGTPLAMLLQSLGVKHLILTGIAGNLCVLFTAHDAHMQSYRITVPRDCMASETEIAHQLTLHQLGVLGIETPESGELDFDTSD